jgi:hypothetical protein
MIIDISKVRGNVSSLSVNGSPVSLVRELLPPGGYLVAIRASAGVNEIVLNDGTLFTCRRGGIDFPDQSALDEVTEAVVAAIERLEPVTLHCY